MVHANAKAGSSAAVHARPLAELLECPPEIGELLNSATRTVSSEAGEAIFRQHCPCQGLYLVVSGEFLRKSERLNTRITLGIARSGDLVELAAALGDGNHTYTLTALTPASLLLIPIEPLRQALDRHPPLRLRLLEELAREVSRAYVTSRLSRTLAGRRGMS